MDWRQVGFLAADLGSRWGAAESFLRFSPSGPQAFAGLYGTIQRGSATGLYVEGSNVSAVEEMRQPFRRPSQHEGKNQRGTIPGPRQTPEWPIKAGEYSAETSCSSRAERLTLCPFICRLECLNGQTLPPLRSSVERRSLPRC